MSGRGGMAIDVAGVCSGETANNSTQSLALVLSILFAAYVLIDSALASWVILRKVTESEAASAPVLGAGVAVGVAA